MPVRVTRSHLLTCSSHPSTVAYPPTQRGSSAHARDAYIVPSPGTAQAPEEITFRGHTSPTKRAVFKSGGGGGGGTGTLILP